MSTQGDKLKAIADAIRAKEGSSDPIAANDFPARIAATQTVTQLTTLPTPGTSAHISHFQPLIHQYGEIVTGTVNEIFASSNYTVMGDTQTLNDNNLRLDYTFGMDIIMRRNSVFSIVRPISNFGNATAADVAAGKTFTSEAGVKVSGTGQLSQFFTGTLRVRSATDIVEFVSPAGLIQRYNQVVNDVISVYVPGTVIFVNIMDSNNNQFRPKVIEGFDNTYWVDTTKDVSGYRISYGAFIAKPGYSVYNIEFDIF